jgi:hypothetical protein
MWQMLVDSKVTGLPVLKKIFTMVLNDTLMLVPGGCHLVTMFLSLQHGGCWMSSCINTMVQTVQALKPADPQHQRAFSQWMLQQDAADPNFLANSWSQMKHASHGMVFWRAIICKHDQNPHSIQETDYN